MLLINHPHKPNPLNNQSIDSAVLLSRLHLYIPPTYTINVVGKLTGQIRWIDRTQYNISNEYVPYGVYRGSAPNIRLLTLFSR